MTRHRADHVSMAFLLFELVLSWLGLVANLMLAFVAWSARTSV